MIVKESINFERGKDPKKILDLGIEQAILKGLKELQLSPGIGSINLIRGGYQLAVNDYNRKYTPEFRALLDSCFPFSPFLEAGVSINSGSKTFRKLFIVEIKPEYVKIFQDSFDEEGFIKN